jgi:chemotaxis signal transduction protein
MAKSASTRKKKRSVRKKEPLQKDIKKQKATLPPKETEKKLAIFRVGDEMYAFHLDIIMETLYNYSLKPVEHMPEMYKGIISFRNKSVPVVSLRELLKAGDTGSSDPVCVVVTMDKEHMGFIIDTDVDIIPESMGQRYPLPDCYSIEESEFIEGIFWLDQRFIGILNPLRMMEILVGWRKGDEKK